MAMSKKKDYSDPQTHSLRGSPSSLVGGGLSILGQLSGVEGHSVHSHEVVMPNLGCTQETCQRSSFPGSERQKDRAVSEFLHPEK